MTGPYFTNALSTLSLDNHQAAAWLGVSVRAVQRYRVTGAPGPVVRALGMALMVQDYLERFVRDDSGYALDWRE